MSDYMPHISLVISVVMGVIAFFLKRELDNKDKAIIRLDERINHLEDRLQAQEIAHEKLSGRIDTVIEILERVEKKLESL